MKSSIPKGDQKALPAALDALCLLDPQELSRGRAGKRSC